MVEAVNPSTVFKIRIAGMGIASLMIIGTVILSVSSLLGANKAAEERTTYKARCHAAVKQGEYPAYSILKANPDGCQIMLPQGGRPVNVEWGEGFFNKIISYRTY